MEGDGNNETFNSSRRASLCNASALLTTENVNRRPIVYILFEQSFTGFTWNTLGGCGKEALLNPIVRNVVCNF